MFAEPSNPVLSGMEEILMKCLLNRRMVENREIRLKESFCVMMWCEDIHKKPRCVKYQITFYCYKYHIL